jgi:hypothetical protein
MAVKGRDEHASQWEGGRNADLGDQRSPSIIWHRLHPRFSKEHLVYG